MSRRVYAGPSLHRSATFRPTRKRSLWQRLRGTAASQSSYRTSRVKPVVDLRRMTHADGTQSRKAQRALDREAKHRQRRRARQAREVQRGFQHQSSLASKIVSRQALRHHRGAKSLLQRGGRVRQSNAKSNHASNIRAHAQTVTDAPAMPDVTPIQSKTSSASIGHAVSIQQTIARPKQPVSTTTDSLQAHDVLALSSPTPSTSDVSLSQLVSYSPQTSVSTNAPSINDVPLVVPASYELLTSNETGHSAKSSDTHTHVISKGGADTKHADRVAWHARLSLYVQERFQKIVRRRGRAANQLKSVEEQRTPVWRERVAYALRKVLRPFWNHTKRVCHVMWQFIRRPVLLIGSFGSVTAVIVLLGFSSLFRVEQIVLDGDTSIQQHQLTQLFADRLDQPAWWQAPSRSILSWRNAAVAQAVTEAYPSIAHVQIERKYPNVLVVHVEDREPQAIWRSGDALLFVDEYGFACCAATLGDWARGDIPRISDRSARAVSERTQVTQARHIAYVQAVQDAFHEQLPTLVIDRYEFPAARAEEVHLITQEGVRVMLSLTEPAHEQVNKLRIAIAQDIRDRFHTLEYIDLRVAEYVYYR